MQTMLEGTHLLHESFSTLHEAQETKMTPCYLSFCMTALAKVEQCPLVGILLLLMELDLQVVLVLPLDRNLLSG